MTGKQPILIVEDDIEDQELFTEAYKELGEPMKLLFFDRAHALLDYLRTTTDQPFGIITDIKMPGMDGIELRNEICKDEHLRKKSIPFIFLTTTSQKSIVERVYELQVQGFFPKANSFPGLVAQLRLILDYWRACLHPNSTR